MNWPQKQHTNQQYQPAIACQAGMMKNDGGGNKIID
jgi:hypothetical protein